MRLALVLLVVVWLPVTAAYSQSVEITGPDRRAMLEGETVTITWRASGLRSVSIVAVGERTKLGNASRGMFAIPVAESIPAGQEEAQWKVPWIDSVQFFIKIKGYDAFGRQVVVTERGYGFRPAVLANRMEDGLYLDLHQRTNQRLYVQKNYRITHAYLSSSSENYDWRPRGSHVRAAHDHAGVFTIIEKKRLHHSQLFDVPMPYAMRYHGGHFIHATSRNLYRNLGEPASAGCNRLTRADAEQVYRMTPLGTRVEVIGPE